MIRLAQENRTNFRVKFPFGHRPVVCVRTYNLQLSDLSETGMKLVSAPGFAPNVGETIKGKLTFADGHCDHFQGVVVRVVGDLIALQFTNYFDRSRVEKELELMKVVIKPAVQKSVPVVSNAVMENAPAAVISLAQSRQNVLRLV
jgi:hypothetical protein